MKLPKDALTRIALVALLVGATVGYFLGERDSAGALLLVAFLIFVLDLVSRGD